MYQAQWSCDACTFKQSANNNRCEICSAPNPFKVGSNSFQSGGSYYQPPAKPKPVAKKELMHQSKPRKNGEFGKIKYQTDRITKQQVLDTYAIYLLNKDVATSSWPLYVFGENDIDKVRVKGSERDMIGGLAGVLGDYDTSVSFGITTTFYRDKYVNKDFAAFKKIIDKDFEVLLKYIKHGHDIIVPSPNLQDLHGYYEKSYWKNVDGQKKQVIFHNIGTGLACIPFNYIEYIQQKFDILKQIGEKNSVDGIAMKVKAEAAAQDNDDSKVADESNNDKDKDKKQDSNAPSNNEETQNAENQGKKDESKPQPQAMNTDGDEELAKAIAQSLQGQ